jgi:fumarylacetoacetase
MTHHQVEISLTHPNDPKLKSFIDVDATSDFPIQNLPYGVFSTPDSAQRRVGVAIGDFVLDLAMLEAEGLLKAGEPGILAQDSLNAFMALGPKIWSATRAQISELLRHDNATLRDNAAFRQRALLPRKEVQLHVPFAVAG